MESLEFGEEFFGTKHSHTCFVVKLAASLSLFQHVADLAAGFDHRADNCEYQSIPMQRHKAMAARAALFWIPCGHPAV